MSSQNKSSGDGAFLSDLSVADKPWDVHRATATLIAVLYQGTFPEYAERINDCSNRLGFQFSLLSGHGELKLKLFAARFCRVRQCPVCQWRRSMAWRARFFEALPRILADHPKARFLFLTLTVKNCEVGQLRQTLGEMNAAWRRLVLLKPWPGLGFVRAVEVTRNPETNEAHPHFHVLVMVPSTYFGRGYIKQEDWRSLWQRALRVDYLPVVNVKAVKGKGGKTDDLALGLLETLKYQTKPQDLVAAGPAWLAELTHQLHKTRGVAVGGVLKQYIAQEEPEDLINDGSPDLNEPVSNFYADWLPVVRRYWVNKEL